MLAMTYFPTLHDYLHQSSLLLQAYPTARITTKYSLPRKASQKSSAQQTTETDGSQKPKREPAATLTLRTYHPESGICLKYQTDKAAEVGRLIAGLGRVAKGEIIDLPAESDAAAGQPGAGIVVGEGVPLAGGDPMQIDDQLSQPDGGAAAKTAAQMTLQGQQQQQGGGSAKKKKKGKK